MPLSSERLREVVSELMSRPHHEKVRALLHEILVNELGASSTEVDFERRVPEVHGRIDALLGRTLFEFKTDLRREQRDAESQLPGYLSQRQTETGAHFVAVATDGATFQAYELRAGKLVHLDSFSLQTDKPHELLAWLSSVVAIKEDLEPTADVVKRELGRGSIAWILARRELTAIWNEVGQQPGVRLKRDLWAQLIRHVYGSALNEDVLFLQHTYLTIIAKTMAAKVLGVSVPNPDDLLSGRAFREAGIGGVVESDFFDWLLASEKGLDLVHRIALQASRFRLEDVQTDVLKGLYESLIDTEQRHFLGEYYTPDWLAERICAEAIDDPVNQRVLDPACGSGTFVFHAVRGFLIAAEQAGIPTPDAIERASNQIFGIDVHPVSAQIARVTFLLAIGQARLKQRPPSLNIPVYIGDSLQWNTRGFLAERDVIIETPESKELLEFPSEVTHDPSVFDAVIGQMLEFSRQNTVPEGLTAWLKRTYKLSPEATNVLAHTYSTLHELDRSGRDHIWGFVMRNLVRPIWLAQDSQKVDVVIGNPPWLSYRFMDAEMQKRFREECQACGIWAGGKVATHQDMSGYFFVRAVELYLKANGKIAFVMPYASMTRRQFEGFRKGLYGASQRRGSRLVYATVQFTGAWVLADNVQPLFPVPSCVLFGNTGDGEGPRLPAIVSVASGTLPKRDASLGEAATHITWHEAPWPSQNDNDEASPYSDKFHQGATLVPRVLCVVEAAPAGTLGANLSAPVVQSRRTSQEKEPWKSLPPLRDNIEKEFVRPLYMGESIAPYRVFDPALAVVPWSETEGRLLDSQAAQRLGYVQLARWLGNAERLWVEHGRDTMLFGERIDYHGSLAIQFPLAPLRVVYSTSGTLPAASVISDARGIIDTKLYWARVDSKQEAQYLLAVLNSETARQRAEHLQSRGQWGARDFHKVILSLPIPSFDASNKLHRALAGAAAHAEKVAARVQLHERMHFVKARQEIRAALNEDGISPAIDKLVARLLAAT
ncbi:MAG: N-6 DNA methylase [Chloroflexi bacterium]|nr:N-6 DNA methylase [Chloroflexota bacterium]